MKEHLLSFEYSDMNCVDFLTLLTQNISCRIQRRNNFSKSLHVTKKYYE